MTAYPPAEIPSGRVLINGETHLVDPKGGKIPISSVTAMDLLKDETVRKIMGHQIALSEQISRFKAHVFADIAALRGLMSQEYNAPLGGAKGNITLTSYDGLFKIQVQVSDRLTFGPELQTAKSIIDECLNEWASTARAELRTIVTSAFNTDKEGKVNAAEIFKLRRFKFEDARWREALRAIDDAVMVESSTTYVRAYQRNASDMPWQAVTIDLAKA